MFSPLHILLKKIIPRFTDENCGKGCERGLCDACCPAGRTCEQPKPIGELVDKVIAEAEQKKINAKHGTYFAGGKL